MIRSLLLLACCILAAVSTTGQSSPPASSGGYPYLLHLETVTFDDQACVLLRRDGQFHLEVQKGERTKVFEGTLSDAKMIEVEKLMNDDGLRQLTERQIPAASGYIMLDELHVDLFRDDHWQVLFFPDASSRKSFDHFIAPLVRWLDALHKEPHQELSEDEGKNDCQLPKRIVLQRRPPNAAPVSTGP